MHLPPPSLPFTAWRHFKEAFSADVVYDAIQSSDIKVQTCIDPFGGSGTTAVACQFMSVQPTTIETNPYLADLIKAKLHLYDVDDLVRDFSTIMRLSGAIRDDVRTPSLPPTFIEPGVNNRWIFSRDVAHRILSIAAACEQLRLEHHRRLFRVLLGGTLVSVSNVVVNGKGRRYRGGWSKVRRMPGTVDRLFTASVTAAIAEIRRYARRPTVPYTVIHGDSRTRIRALDHFDLAVFSPPYPNSFDYTDVYNIELWILGYLTGKEGNRALRTSTLSSHVQINRPFSPSPCGSQRLDDTIASLQSRVHRMWNPNIPSMIASYFAELLGIVSCLASRLTPGGRIWMVVGDSSYAGVAISVAQILAELVPTMGLGVDRLETLRELRKSAQQGGQNQLAENLLVLRPS